MARSLRRTLENASSNAPATRSLAPLLPFPDGASEFVERLEPRRRLRDVALTKENQQVVHSLVREFRRADEIRSRGLPVRSKLLFCGPPGCGKTLCAEVFAGEVGLPFLAVKLDRLVSSYLGETASNIRKLFELARKQACVLFLDEFDAIARSREDAAEHSELRRVVNSLLLFIDRMEPKGFMIAATNLDGAIDPAVRRRFDDVLWFTMPDRLMIAAFVAAKFKNVETDFDVTTQLDALTGYSYADIERICVHAMRTVIVEHRETLTSDDMRSALANEVRRRNGGKDT